MNIESITYAVGHPDFGLDGCWSPQTTALLKAKKTKSLELNKWWALTPQNWVCPVCSLPKKDLARVGKESNLIAKLVSHHDHIVEEVAKALDSEIHSADGDALKEYTKKFARNFLVRFQPTIICEQCNNAELSVKQKHNIPMSVTLSPVDMKLLNDQNSENGSEVSFLVQALRQWNLKVKHLVQEVQKSFDGHLHLGQFIPQFHGDSVEQHAKNKLYEGGFSHHLRKEEILAEFLEFSVSKPQRGNSKDVLLPEPTIQAFKSYKHPSPLRQKSLEAVGSDWRCPICRRSLFECFRSSPKSKTTFNCDIFPKSSFFLAPAQSSEVVYICGDCHKFKQLYREHLIKEGLGSFYKEDCWFLSEEVVQECIEALAHQRHLYDFTPAVSYTFETELIDEWT